MKLTQRGTGVDKAEDVCIICLQGLGKSREKPEVSTRGRKGLQEGAMSNYKYFSFLSKKSLKEGTGLSVCTRGGELPSCTV